jgi:hypothetical protein
LKDGSLGIKEDYVNLYYIGRTVIYINDVISFSRYRYSIQYLGNHPFHGVCLHTIRIPYTVERIGDKCFYKCKSLIEITFEFGSRLRHIDKAAFQQTDVTSI